MEALPAKRPPGEPLPSTSCWGGRGTSCPSQSAESLGRTPGVGCLMELLASLGLSEVWASSKVSESASGHWNHLPLQDQPGFHVPKLGTCPGCFPKLFLASGAPEGFWRCQKGGHALSEIPPLFCSQQVAPRAGHSLRQDKSPQNGMGRGLCILVLPVGFLASHPIALSFRFLICKMGQAKSLKLVGEDTLLYVYTEPNIQ